MIVMREIQPRPAAGAYLERASRRLRVLGRPSATQVLINARAGHLGTGTQMSGYPTNQDLKRLVLWGMNSNREPLCNMSNTARAMLYTSAKYVAIITLAVAPFISVAQENVAKPDSVLIHPGETLYITFQRTGDSLTLAHVGTDADKAAQLILKMAPLKEVQGTSLNVQNKFDKNLYYKAEIRLLSKNKKFNTSVVPVLAGKFSFESWPYAIEELALSGFELKGK
jgi:hypothetical protein